MNLVAGTLDCLSFVFWTAGILVRQFDRGREGYLPSLASKTGKELVQEMETVANEKAPAPEKPTAQVIGFR